VGKGPKYDVFQNFDLPVLKFVLKLDEGHEQHHPSSFSMNILNGYTTVFDH
jgi:hypothetical protein